MYRFMDDPERISLLPSVFQQSVNIENGLLPKVIFIQAIRLSGVPNTNKITIPRDICNHFQGVPPAHSNDWHMSAGATRCDALVDMFSTMSRL
jgi:hypothetical protein